MSPSDSCAMPTTDKPCAWYCVLSRSSSGMIARHGPHHVAQKSSTTTRPRSRASVTSSVPETRRVSSSGGAVPTASGGIAPIVPGGTRVGSARPKLATASTQTIDRIGRARRIETSG